MQKFVIREIRNPREKELDSEIEWLCSGLGFVTMRDHERTASKVFRAVIDAAKDGRGLSSDEIAERVGISRGTAVHHIKKYMDSGMLIRKSSTYELRMHSLTDTIDEMELDIKRIFDRMRKMSERIDNELGL